MRIVSNGQDKNLKPSSTDIQQLLYNFPPDAKTSTGAPFWSGPKRAPKPLEFDINNKDHLDFIIGGANLLAFIYGLKEPNATVDDFKKVLEQVVIEPFQPKSGVEIAATDAEAEEQANNLSGSIDDEQIRKIAASLPEPSTLAGYRLTPIEFEKMMIPTTILSLLLLHLIVEH